MKINEWKVIVVEDEDDGVQMLSQILEHHHIKIYVAKDGLQCLTLLKSVQPTLIIMDLALPHMDGWQTLAAIREDNRTKGLPVVAVTAYGSPEVREEVFNAGFDGYFEKPIDVASFVESLQSVITAS